MGLRAVTYQDPQGRNWRRLLPDDVEDAEAEYGIPAGPPDLAELELPLDLEVRLHNELFNRGLWAERDVRAARDAIQAAVMAAIRIDAARVWSLYRTSEATSEEANDGGREHSAQQSDAGVHNRRRIGSRSDSGLPGPR